MKSFSLISLSFLLLVSCSSEPPAKNKEVASSFFRAPKKTATTVTALTASSKDIPLVIRASGKTEASERFQAKSPADVRVQKIFVEEGSKVNPGDPLVSFDDKDTKLRLAKARAEIKEGEAGVADMNYLIQNKEKLLEENKMSETEAGGLDERLALYEATIERAKAEIDLYEHTGDLSQLNCPIAGLVTRRDVGEGVDVASGQALLEVVRLDPLQFVFGVSPDESTALSKGRNITVRFNALPGQDFSAEIISIGAESRSETNGIPVKVRIPNSEFFLKSDMKGDVVIPTEARKKVFFVPESAVVRSDKSRYIYKVETNKVKKVSVDVGESSGSLIAVEKGLVDGDVVVVSSEGDLRDGDPVEVKK